MVPIRGYLRRSSCAALNENTPAPHRSSCLKTCFPVGGAVLGEVLGPLEDGAFMEDVCPSRGLASCTSLWLSLLLCVDGDLTS